LSGSAVFPVAIAAALAAIGFAGAYAADSPYHIHCDAVTDVGGYYIGEIAATRKYTGDDAAKIIDGLYASGYYANVDKQLMGATTLWIGIDEADGASTIFFYGDNGCAFGYDDTWDRDSVVSLLSGLGIAVPSDPLPGSQ
jgi:hypothetical protein